MRICGVIPARLDSTRLPRKLLLDVTGRPLIQHTWERARAAPALSELVVAADSPEIVRVVEALGGRAVLTGAHPSGTDRIAEVVSRRLVDADIFVNIQGDEPDLAPEHVALAVRALVECSDADMATLGTPIRTLEEVTDNACVKVVSSGTGRALYFSREPIPHVRDRDRENVLSAKAPWVRHVGLYAYRRNALLRMAALPVSPLERWERLEQLRALEDGFRIQVALVEHSPPGIDTPEDYRRFVARCAAAAEGGDDRHSRAPPA